MTKQTKTRQKPAPTRKQKPLMIHMSDDLVGELDAWRATQEGEPSRSDAIRRCVRRVLRQEKEAGAS